MGKALKSNKNTMRPGTRVLREHPIKKPTCRVSRKRLTMLRRRIAVLLDEKYSWEEKNRSLLDNLNREKILSASFKKEAFHWQGMYHEATISNNTYKVKQEGIAQTLSMCLKGIDSMYPSIVTLSGAVSSNKIWITDLVNSLRSLGNEDYLPRHFRDGGQVISDSSKREKRMKHKVGPMVKGMLIKKPTIRLERLQQPQDQDQTNIDLSPPRENPLTPIPEENEQEANIQLRHISIRQKRRLGLGSSAWRRRRQEEIEKERQRERENKCPSLAEESSDSDDHLGPVVRLRDINNLLLSSNLLNKVEPARGEEGQGASRPSDHDSRRVRTNEDPLEGCSWMHRSSVRQKSKGASEKEKLQTSVYKTDSSDEESEAMENNIHKNVQNLISDTLYKRQTFTVLRDNSSSSSSADTSHETSDFSKAEPDSTNNGDEQVLVLTDTSPAEDSLYLPSNSHSSLGARKHLYFTDTTSFGTVVSKSKPEDSSLINTDLPKVPISKVTDPVRISKNIQNKRRSSYCDNCSPIMSPARPISSPAGLITSPDVQGKRIRKPKNHLYPGEESSNPVPKEKNAKSARFPIPKKSIPENISTRGRKSLKKRVSTERLSSSGDCHSGRPSPGPLPKKKKETAKKRVSKEVQNVTSTGKLSSGSSSKKKKVSVAEKKRTSKEQIDGENLINTGRPSSDSSSKKKKVLVAEKKRGSKEQFPGENERNSGRTSLVSSSVKKKGQVGGKKSSVKKSLYTPRNSGAGEDEGETLRMRRNKVKISYRESPINVKMRRP